MKRYFVNIKFLSLLILFAVLLGCTASDDSEANSREIEAEEFRPFTIASFEGKAIDTAKMRGEVIVVNFWASWCGPCKMEAKDLEAIYIKYRSKGVSFVGVAIDDTLENARGFIERYQVTYPNAFDSDNRLAAEYEIFAVPTTYVIDREGWNTFTHRGAISRSQLENAIKRVL
ncbi:MAG: TlpA disulfide reductase family protein [Thermodesulfobacteriota bacterium]